jgi:uncharacterized protein
MKKRTLDKAWPVPATDHVQEGVDRLVAAFEPLRIVVFGSYARGDSRPGSDLDLMVELGAVNDLRETAIAMRRVLADLPVPKDVVVTTPQETAVRSESLRHVVGLALREGKTVYEKAGGDGAKPRITKHLTRLSRCHRRC